MAFPRFLSIKAELAELNSLKAKALPRETSLICRVRLQICIQLFFLSLDFGALTLFALGGAQCALTAEIALKTQKNEKIFF